MAKEKTLTINGVNFTLLTGKRAEALVDEYRWAERNGNTRLWHVYGSCSRAKEIAFDECDEVRRKVNGGIMFISGYNTCTFSLIYAIWQSGEKCYIVKETHCNRYIAEVNKGALR